MFAAAPWYFPVFFLFCLIAEHGDQQPVTKACCYIRLIQSVFRNVIHCLRRSYDNIS